MMKQKNEKGRSLLEMLAVIGIIAVITMGAVNGMAYAMMLFRVSFLRDEIETIADGVRDLYSWARSYKWLENMTFICDNDILTRACVRKPGEAPTHWAHSFGGEIRVAKHLNDDMSFTITVTGLTKDVCSRLWDEKWTNVEKPSPGGSLCGKAQNTNSLTFTVR